MRFILSVAFLVCSGWTIAQAPLFIPYQAIARDAAGLPLSSALIDARFSIHSQQSAGPIIWQELQQVTTSALGLFTVQLGSVESLSAINWSESQLYMQVEIDLGSGFVDIGTQRLLSVPYALHARSIDVRVSTSGDSLFIGNGSGVIVPGISQANVPDNGNSALHTCGVDHVHNVSQQYGQLTDQEGNVYKTILIGSQEWMAENLITETYRNGEAISSNLTIEQWDNTNMTQLGAFDNYNGDMSLACPYGKLYNWYACTDERNLCPVGWHVPSLEDWQALALQLGGEETAGASLKSTGTLEGANGLWLEPNQDATNASGFSGIPAGFRNDFGVYDYMGYIGYWWTSSEYNAGNAWYVDLNYFETALGVYDYSKQYGFSVRCIRD